jgi:hypothetical protein
MRKRTTGAAGLGVLGAAGGLWLAVARLGRHSGTTPEELAMALPGDDLVPGAGLVVDRATTLPAEPEHVWPWLVQLGKGRAGWYLPAWVERAVPAGRRGLRDLDPALQGLAAGDEIPDWGPGQPVFRAVTVDPPRALVYLSVRDRDDDHRWPASGPPYPPSALVMSWALVLSAARHPDGSPGSRLHLRLRINRIGNRAPALVRSVGGLIDGATVHPMFAGLAERVR